MSTSFEHLVDPLAETGPTQCPSRSTTRPDSMADRSVISATIESTYKVEIKVLRPLSGASTSGPGSPRVSHASFNTRKGPRPASLPSLGSDSVGGFNKRVTASTDVRPIGSPRCRVQLPPVCPTYPTLNWTYSSPERSEHLFAIFGPWHT